MTTAVKLATESNLIAKYNLTVVADHARASIRAALFKAAGVEFIGENSSAMTIVLTGAATWLLLLLACAYSRAKDPRGRRR